MSSTSTKLRQPWLNLARAAWILVAVGSIALFFMSTVNTARLPLPSCAAPDAACPATTQITSEDADIAAGMGLPIPLLPLSLGFSITARLSLALVGLLIFWRRSDDWMAMFISAALMTVLLEGAQGIDTAFQPIMNLLFGIGTALFIPLPFIFPNGRFEPHWIGWPAIGITIPYVLLVTFFLESPLFGSATAVVTLLWVALSFYAMPYRYFRVSNPVERQQTKWVILGILATFLTATYYASFSALFPVSQPSQMRLILRLINLPLYVAGYGFFAFAILRAMLRHRLWDIDIIVRRTLQYTAVTGLMALTYWGSVVLLQRLFTAVLGEQTAVSIVISTLFIAALFTPLRRRIQAIVDRRFFRQKYDAQKVLSQFAQTARGEVSLEVLVTELQDVIQETVQPEMVLLWMKSIKSVQQEF